MSQFLAYAAASPLLFVIDYLILSFPPILSDFS